MEAELFALDLVKTLIVPTISLYINIRQQNVVKNYIIITDFTVVAIFNILLS